MQRLGTSRVIGLPYKDDTMACMKEVEHMMISIELVRIGH